MEEQTADRYEVYPVRLYGRISLRGSVAATLAEL